ncbi:outer membrane protein assembly factor BamA [Weeksella sp. HMSC059D05]|uniref:Outer membrane protein assembly factor BamA n=2 Tax=Weeksellaceae TaxID=2762318 RepID=F0P2H7_WEEVC|nr:outer membrane protein assembly complex, YaeT protein [Weeksella virosa DSM 16922]OFM82898.1 outer membrane protein assembly factor BamA [Weeksella sp. HMSC059D05]SUP54119.1 Outer membrane protein omp85 precursor [Weeksella virosa]VEH64557.1 Outer membrane protein omp85 precursor [Weeksella virosa]
MWMLGAYLTVVNAQVNDSIPTAVEQTTVTPQDFSNLNNVRTFILKDVQLTGDTKFSKNQILRFAGFSLGDEIEIPGTKINNAVKKLWRSKMFSDINVYVSSVQGNEVILELNLLGLPELEAINISGIKKSQRDEVIKKNKLDPGVKITNNLLNQTRNNIKEYYVQKGFPEPVITINRIKTDGDKENLDIKVDRGPRVKIKDIVFEGNHELSDAKLRKAMKDTKRKSINFFKPSKLIDEKYQDDLKKVVEKYKSVGFRDAKIISDRIEKISDDRVIIHIKVDEGKPYYLGNITFAGNSVFTSEQLARVFSYKTGDRYDAVGINKKVTGSEKDDDIKTLYMDDGYLFASVIPIEKNIQDDVIDLEIKINEGTQATINRVTISGNTEAHDHILYRELRTQPGDLFSKSNIKRTMYELAATSYLEPTQIVPDVQPNFENNTVDINWKVAPKSSSQVELQGGYGGGTFIGTLGLTFGNFSIGNIFNRKAWKPVPLGDGQQLSIRAQAGYGYQNYSFSFVEPWIGGKRPTSLSTSFYYSRYNYRDNHNERIKLNIIGGSVGMSKLLTWPDDYFRLSHSISFQQYDYENYNLFTAGNINYSNGKSNNINYTIGLSRNSAGPNQIFPQGGSDFSVNATMTFPYSLVNNKDYKKLSPQEKIEWLEYYKIKVKGNWYKELIGKLVGRLGAEFGYLGSYNHDIGTIPFERFYIGGTGLMQQRFDGREIIPLRGYEDSTNSGGRVNEDITPEGGGAIYNKFLFELRYPITMSQTANIFALAFAEAGNTWENAREYKPFELRRSAGIGVRVFMPAFGMLGFDFGYGFDKAIGAIEPSGWQTHFIIGQSF